MARFLVVLAAAGLLLLWIGSSDRPVEPAPDGPDVVFSPPTGELRRLVEPIGRAMAGKSAAVDLAFFYRRVADLIKPDLERGYTGAVTTEQARRLHREMGLALHRIDPHTAHHATLQPLLESVFAEVVGTETKRLTKDDQAKIAGLFNAVAWSLWTASPEGERVAYEQPESVWNEPEDVIWTRGPPAAEFAHGLLTPDVEPLEDLPDPTQPGANFGLLPPTEAEVEALADAPKFASLGLDGTGAGQTRLLYRSLRKFDPHAYTERQKTGDCTSHGTRNACDTSRAFELDVEGKLGSFFERGATECIYGYRGHSGQGMSVTRAVKFVHEHGGIAVRKEYGPFNLTKYNVDVGVRWGRQGGPPDEVLREIRDYQSQSVVRVRSVAEARDAIYNGMSMVVGCGYSFSSQRDEHGFAKRTRGGWSHCMAWVATAPHRVLVPGSTSDEPCFLIVNSWGDWNAGPKGVFRDIPDGSFWVTTKDAAGMIADADRYGQAIAVGNIKNYPPEPLDDWGFDYLALSPPDDTPTVASPRLSSHLVGVAALAYGTSLLVAPRPDVTIPTEDELDGVTPTPRPRPRPTPGKCDKCGGRGVVIMPDGHETECPNPDCPFRSRLVELTIRNVDGSSRRENHVLGLAP